MHIFGQSVGNNAYIGRSTNAGMFDTNSINGEVSTAVEQKDEMVVFRDTDANPNLKVRISYNDFREAASLQIVNSDERQSQNGAEHVVQASFPLPNMSADTAYDLMSQNLTNNDAADYVSVKDMGNGGYLVEVGEFGPGKIHNGFFISDSGPARLRSAPPRG